MFYKMAKTRGNQTMAQETHVHANQSTEGAPLPQKMSIDEINRVKSNSHST